MTQWYFQGCSSRNPGLVAFCTAWLKHLHINFEEFVLSATCDLQNVCHPSHFRHRSAFKMKRRFFFSKRFKRKKPTNKATSEPAPKRGNNSTDTGNDSTNAPVHAFASTFDVIENRIGSERLMPAPHGLGATVKFFHRGARNTETEGYYTAHGAAAVALSELYKETLNRNAHSQLESVNINHKLLRRVLRNLLLQRRCKIEIWKPVDGDQTAAITVKNWMLDKRASPASFAQVKEMLFHARDNVLGTQSSEDESLYAAESASCMSLVVNNRRLECGCEALELRTVIANEAKRFLGISQDRVYWNISVSQHCTVCRDKCGPMQRRSVGWLCVDLPRTGNCKPSFSSRIHTGFASYWDAHYTL